MQLCCQSKSSTGEREALELRDGDKTRFLGKGALKRLKMLMKLLLLQS